MPPKAKQQQPSRARVVRRGAGVGERVTACLEQYPPRKRLWLLALLLWAAFFAHALVSLPVGLGIGYSQAWVWALLWVALQIVAISVYYWKRVRSHTGNNSTSNSNNSNSTGAGGGGGGGEGQGKQPLPLPSWFAKVALLPVLVVLVLTVVYAVAGAQLSSAAWYLSDKHAAEWRVNCSAASPFAWDPSTLVWVYLPDGWTVDAAHYTARHSLDRYHCVAPLRYTGAGAGGCAQPSNLYATCSVAAKDNPDQACVTVATRQCWSDRLWYVRVVRNGTHFYGSMQRSEYGEFLVALGLQTDQGADPARALLVDRVRGDRDWFVTRKAQIVHGLVVLFLAALGAVLVYLVVVCLAVSVESAAPEPKDPGEEAPPPDAVEIDVAVNEVELRFEEGSASPVAVPVAGKTPPAPAAAAEPARAATAAPWPPPVGVVVALQQLPPQTPTMAMGTTTTTTGMPLGQLSPQMAAVADLPNPLSLPRFAASAASAGDAPSSGVLPPAAAMSP